MAGKKKSITHRNNGKYTRAAANAARNKAKHIEQMKKANPNWPNKKG